MITVCRGHNPGGQRQAVRGGGDNGDGSVATSKSSFHADHSSRTERQPCACRQGINPPAQLWPQSSQSQGLVRQGQMPSLVMFSTVSLFVYFSPFYLNGSNPVLSFFDYVLILEIWFVLHIAYCCWSFWRNVFWYAQTSIFFLTSR